MLRVLILLDLAAMLMWHAVCMVVGMKLTHSQSVMDALADAETLRRAHVAVHGRGPIKRLRIDTANALRTGDAVLARLAARAAFRAVPGLRGLDATRTGMCGDCLREAR